MTDEAGPAATERAGPSAQAGDAIDPEPSWSRRLPAPLRRAARWLDRHVLGDDFVRAVGKVAGGTAVAQALSVLASPVLTRLYQPEHFGILSIFISLLTLLGTLATFKYEFAVVLPDEQEDDAAAAVLVLCLGLVTTVGAVVAAAVALGGDVIVGWVDAPGLAPFLWLLPIGILATGWYRALSYWAMRVEAFGSLGRTRASQGLAKTGSQLGLGFLAGGGASGLISGELLGRFAGVGTLTRIAMRRREIFRSVRRSDLFEVLRRYRRFPLFLTGASALSIAGGQLPPLLLSAFYGTRVTGWFALAEKAVSMPIALIGRAVADPYVSRAGKLIEQDPARLLRLFRRTTLVLAGLAIVPTAVLLAFGPDLVELVFGAEWRRAGEYLRILAPLMFSRFITMPFMNTLAVVERQDLRLIWDALLLSITLITMLLLPALGYGVTTSLLCYSLGVSATFGIGYLASMHEIKKRATA